MKKSIILLFPFAFFLFWGIWCIIYRQSDLLLVMSIICFILALGFFTFFVLTFVRGLDEVKIKKNGFETTATILYFVDNLAGNRTKNDTKEPVKHGAYQVRLNYTDENGIVRSELTDKVYYGEEAIEISKNEEVKVKCKGKRVFIIK